MTTTPSFTKEAAISDFVQKSGSGLTVIVPAFNEVENIADTVRSLQNQTVKVDEIIVVDDCSTDGTGDAARACGVTVLTPPTNTGTKAGAQNFALERVRTKYTMALDADTTLAPDAIELLLKAFDQPEVAAACGFVVPRHTKSLWERGRYVEYLFAFTFYKPIQDYYQKPLISSGCFSIYQTDVLKDNNGWSTRTMAEDMDLTWSFYQSGHKVRFVPEALCYPIEPHNFSFMRKQLKRWSHGFIQNVQLHWRGVLEIQYLRTLIGLAMWDATIASLAFLILIPLLAIFVSPFFLLGYIIDAPAVLVPILYKAWKRNEFWRALASFPSFLVLRLVNAVFFLEAFWTELIMRKPLSVYEKGH
jgi:biofilm PGA synthesis N-glycosyltransferase PgaC